MYGRFWLGGLLPLRLQLVVGLVCLKGCGGEAVVLPPRDQRGHGGDTGGDQLLHGLALDGQHGLAAGAEYLIGQGQQQAGGAGNGACRDGGCVVGVCVQVYGSFLQLIIARIPRFATNSRCWCFTAAA